MWLKHQSKGIKGDASKGALIGVVLLVIIGLAGGLVYVYRDTFFPPTPPPTVEPQLDMYIKWDGVILNKSYTVVSLVNGDATNATFLIENVSRSVLLEGVNMVYNFYNSFNIGDHIYCLHNMTKNRDLITKNSLASRIDTSYAYLITSGLMQNYQLIDVSGVKFDIYMEINNYWYFAGTLPHSGWSYGNYTTESFVYIYKYQGVNQLTKNQFVYSNIADTENNLLYNIDHIN